MKKIGELGISPWPWKFEGEEDGIGMVFAKDGKLVADLGMDGSSISDARLTKAATELYECLYEAVEESCHECEDDTIEHCRSKCHIARWRDALAKAGGESEVEK